MYEFWLSVESNYSNGRRFLLNSERGKAGRIHSYNIMYYSLITYDFINNNETDLDRHLFKGLRFNAIAEVRYPNS